MASRTPCCPSHEPAFPTSAGVLHTSRPARRRTDGQVVPLCRGREVVQQAMARLLPELLQRAPEGGPPRHRAQRLCHPAPRAGFRPLWRSICWPRLDGRHTPAAMRGVARPALSPAPLHAICSTRARARLFGSLAPFGGRRGGAGGTVGVRGRQGRAAGRARVGGVRDPGRGLRCGLRQCLGQYWAEAAPPGAQSCAGTGPDSGGVLS